MRHQSAFGGACRAGREHDHANVVGLGLDDVFGPRLRPQQIGECNSSAARQRFAVPLDRDGGLDIESGDGDGVERGSQFIAYEGSARFYIADLML